MASKSWVRMRSDIENTTAQGYISPDLSMGTNTDWAKTWFNFLGDGA